MKLLRYIAICTSVLILSGITNAKEINRSPNGKPATDSLSLSYTPVEGINPNRLRWVIALNTAGIVGTYIYFIKPWWSGKKSRFRFKLDWWDNYWLEVDKVGHFYANAQLTRASAHSYRFAGVPRRRSLWLGAANSLILYTAFELTDANFEKWGFSIPDYLANVLGAGFPLAQEYWPSLKYFTLKIGYRPSRYYRDDTQGKRPGFIDYEPYEDIANDYDGLKYWMSMDINGLLPRFARPIWPDWLNLAIGYGAQNLPQRNRALKRRQVFVALDYNLDRLPGESAFLKNLKCVLNAIRFPAPALLIRHDGITAYGFKY